MLLYHHCADIKSVKYGEITLNSEYSDEYAKDAYKWLEMKVGFYPLFIAVGATEEDIENFAKMPKFSKRSLKEAKSCNFKGCKFSDSIDSNFSSIRMTGYQNQWRKLLSEKPGGNEYVKKGKFRNDVLFSFEEARGIFTDYDYWYLVLNGSYKNYQMSSYEEKLIFKPLWKKSKWLKKAVKEPHSVQLVAPKLDLREAKRIWVRNAKTKKYLASLGFENIEVRRMHID